MSTSVAVELDAGIRIFTMTVAVVSEVQVPKNGCFIAAEGVPGVTPGWSHTDP